MPLWIDAILGKSWLRLERGTVEVCHSVLIEARRLHTLAVVQHLPASSQAPLIQLKRRGTRYRLVGSLCDAQALRFGRRNLLAAQVEHLQEVVLLHHSSFLGRSRS